MGAGRGPWAVINEVRPLLAERGRAVSPHVRLRTLAEVVDCLGASGKTGIVDGTEIRVRRPAAGRKDGAAVVILADAGCQGLGVQTGGRVVTPPHRRFKKNAPEWYEEMHERRRKAHFSRRIRGEHGTAHLKSWRTLACHLDRREHMSDTIQAIAGLLSHQRTMDLNSTRQM
ncbi:hypothetical protein [Streptomyces sp. NPDC050263]|uniref:hypothetical protein n=1 Tax=Streptomyces sp. NPDC050263 TaxID=3155037 RepID=UPI00341D72A9